MNILQHVVQIRKYINDVTAGETTYLNGHDRAELKNTAHRSEFFITKFTRFYLCNAIKNRIMLQMCWQFKLFQIYMKENGNRNKRYTNVKTYKTNLIVLTVYSFKWIKKSL